MSETSNTPRIPDEFGYRLAGLTDGEGHFGIVKQTKRGRTTYGCVFIINMRDDDREFVEWLHETTGLGVIYRAGALRQRQGWETNPMVGWRVQKKTECLKLLEIFERYPPLSKKARDFEIWAKAVRYLNGPQPEGREPLARWFEQIRQVRAYQADVSLNYELAALSLFDEVDE